METPYQMLLAAAQNLEWDPSHNFWSDYRNVNIAGILQANHTQLELAREALRKTPVVPLEFSFEWLSKNAERHPFFDNLSLGFCLEMQWSLRQGHFAKAVQAAVAGWDLANAICRGALVTEMLVSSSYFSCVTGVFRRYRSKLRAMDRETTIRELNRIEREREFFEVIFQRDQDWTEKTAEERDQWFSLERFEPRDPEEAGLSIEEQKARYKEMGEFEKKPATESDRMGFEVVSSRAKLEIRMLIIDLALRNHQDQKGEFPDRLDQLIPGFLESIPLDPFGKRPFVYRKKSGQEFSLYSPGPQGIDHGGQFGPWIKVLSGEADYCLDDNDYEKWD